MMHTLRNDLDRLIGTLLFIQPQPAIHTEATAPEKAQQVFWMSTAFSGVRCILQYVLLPFVLPVVGMTANVSDVLFFVISGVAVVSMFVSLRRFWKISYKYRWHYLVAASVAGTILVAHMIYDVRLFLT